MAKLKAPNAGTIVMLIIFAVVGLFLFNTVFPEGIEGDPVFPGEEELIGGGDDQGLVLNIIKIILVGLAVWLAAGLVGKIQDFRFSRKDVFSLVLVGFIVYFSWQYVIGPMWNAPSLTEISWKTAAKMGLLK